MKLTLKKNINIKINYNQSSNSLKFYKVDNNREQKIQIVKTNKYYFKKRKNLMFFFRIQMINTNDNKAFHYKKIIVMKILI